MISCNLYQYRFEFQEAIIDWMEMGSEGENKYNKSTGLITDELKTRVTEKISDGFDLSIIGKIDLAEAEKIAGEEVLFLTEEDLIEGLEDFELVPVKDISPVNISDAKIAQIVETGDKVPEVSVEQTEIIDNKVESDNKYDKIFDDKHDTVTPESETEFDIPEESIEEIKSEGDDKVSENKYEDIIGIELGDFQDLSEKSLPISEPVVVGKEKLTDLIAKENNLTHKDETEIVIINDDMEDSDQISAKKYFTIKINEETLDEQLSAILSDENEKKSDEKLNVDVGHYKKNERIKFIDDQFSNLSEVDESGYAEDPLTERLVKMIEVADGKLELLENAGPEEVFHSYYLEDYTLYNSEKFDTVFKEEVFYMDSDFEFIDNAIIRDDFSKYIHEIDDYFTSEFSHEQSEIAEILGLVHDENEYIDDKLFGEYYKKYDLDMEIDFIKPEMDFFRRSHTGDKNITLYSDNEDEIALSERESIEADISSPEAVIFEESVSEIIEILKQDYNVETDEKYNVEFFKEQDVQETDNSDDVVHKAEPEMVSETVTDITEDIIILDDKESVTGIASEFPDKHDNLIKLLSYLDGLFEKLPEEVIRKFAESEYFELYSKVLKETGV